MIIGISQPTFLPYCGYISLIDFVDEIIFLDDVQFDKRSWQQRNRIRTKKGAHMITVPVISKNLYHQKIKDVKINNSLNFQKKIVNSISQNYSKSAYFNKYSEGLFSILKNGHNKLLDLNLDLLRFICKSININFKYSFSSELNLSSSKSDLILDICEKKGAKTYVSTLGSKSYLNLKEFEKKNIKVNFFEFLDKNYSQLYDNFLENLSIIDLLFNEGNRIPYLGKNDKVTITL